MCADLEPTITLWILTEKITLLHHPSPKPHALHYKEICLTRGHQTITVISPHVISVASRCCLSNKTQTPSNLGFAH